MKRNVQGHDVGTKDVDDFSHSDDVYRWALQLDQELQFLRQLSDEAACNEEGMRQWKRFMQKRPDVSENPAHDGVLMRAAGEKKRVKAKGITKMLKDAFWSGGNGAFQDVAARKCRENNRVCGVTGMTHGNLVHTQLNSIVRHMRDDGMTMSQWLAGNLRAILDPCTMACLGHLVFEGHLIPVASEVPVYDEVAFFWTKIDMVWRTVVGEHFIIETKTGYGTSEAFSNVLEDDGVFDAPLEHIPDTPMTRAAMQLCVTALMLEQRYGWRPTMSVLHVDKGIACSLSVPDWCLDPTVRMDIYHRILCSMSKVAMTMYRKQTQAELAQTDA